MDPSKVVQRLASPVHKAIATKDTTRLRDALFKRHEIYEGAEATAGRTGRGLVLKEVSGPKFYQKMLRSSPHVPTADHEGKLLQVTGNHNSLAVLGR